MTKLIIIYVIAWLRYLNKNDDSDGGNCFIVL